MVLHHIGIVVDNLEEAAPLFEVWMKARRVGGVVEDEGQQARIQLYATNNNDTLLEVIEPIHAPGTPIHEVGDYHLCYTVPDLDAEMQRLHEMGAVVTNAVSTAPLFGNNRLAFLATHSGQLLELLEDPKAPKA
jgi:catechol 2,3-dioxygenase-like lactoylglutathione lyase family enzyme